MDVSGRLALVTGATSGIGRATALALAEAGCRLVVTGRDRSALDELGRRTGATAVPADLADASAVAELAARTLAVGVPDVVVHSAGLGRLAPVTDDTADDLDALLRVNLRAPVQLTAALLPAMLARGTGRLVFLSSIAARLGVGRESLYSASKAALHGYALSVQAELAGTALGVTIVVPGVVDTAFFTRRGGAYDRRIPRPLPASRVAHHVVTAIERDRAELMVPAWLRLPVTLCAVAPQLYTRLAARWG